MVMTFSVCCVFHCCVVGSLSYVHYFVLMLYVAISSFFALLCCSSVDFYVNRPHFPHTFSLDYNDEYKNGPDDGGFLLFLYRFYVWMTQNL